MRELIGVGLLYWIAIIGGGHRAMRHSFTKISKAFETGFDTGDTRSAWRRSRIDPGIGCAWKPLIVRINPA